MRKYHIRAGMVAVALALISPVTAQAIPITDLFNTGVDASGTPLAGLGIADSHYQIIAQPTSGVSAATALNGSWIANDANSSWIGSSVNTGGTGPVGDYTYRTTFTLPVDVDLSSVLIEGLWATDNLGLDILINGNATGNTSLGFGAMFAFSVDSGFVAGTNNLDFIVRNLASFDNPTGLRVDDMTGSFELAGNTTGDVPEPGMLGLFGLGLAGLGLAARRRRRA